MEAIMRLENRTAVVKEPREDWPGDYTVDQVRRKSAAMFCRSVRLIGSAKALVNRPLKPELGERIPQGSACPASHHVRDPQQLPAPLVFFSCP